MPSALAPVSSWQSLTRWFVALTLAVGAPFVWARYPVVPALPAPIQAMQAPGKLTVVSFTDFQCPYCRKTHPLLTELRKRPDVEFHRFMAPLEMHPGAEPAALGYLCVPEDKRDALADLLYAADETHLTPPGVVEMGRLLGADAEAMTSCMTSAETRAQLAADKKLFQDVGGAGLPTTYVGRSVIVGYDVDRYQRIIGRADPSPAEMPVWTLFLLTGITIALAFVPSLRDESVARSSGNRGDSQKAEAKLDEAAPDETDPPKKSEPSEPKAEPAGNPEA